MRPYTRSPIGIDVGSRYVKAAQVAGAADAPVLVAAASLERAEPGIPWSADEAARLCAVLERRGFEGRCVVTAVPTNQCLTGVLSLPPVESGAPLREIAAAEMAQMHRCEPESLGIALWDLPAPARGGEGRAMMAAGCRHDQAETLLAVLDAVTLDVCALDIEGWALVRACRRQLAAGGTEATTAILELGWDAASLALVHGTTLIYKRTLLGTGLASFFGTVQRDQRFELPVIDHLLVHAGVDDAAADAGDTMLAAKMRGLLDNHLEQLAQELSLSLAYAAHQYPDAPVQRLLVTGGGARIAGLAPWLARTLDIDAQLVTPATACEVDASLAADAHAPELCVALGLALHRPEETA